MTVPGVFDVAGASTGATVTVNCQGTTRHGQYYFTGFALNNSPNAVYTSLSVNDGTNITLLPAFLPGTPRGLTYDLDGNLVDDGRWAIGYDGENRPTWFETAPAAVAAGVPKVAYHIFYDYLGRRVIRHPYAWGGSSWVTSGAQECYLYRGWNLIARLDDGVRTRNWFWGLDLSGSSDGAGGVGGLLLAQDGGQSYFPAYDALGNIHAMIKASDGALAACYEYDAFGQTIRETGIYAAANPFRFSTKYTDIETTLVYYGTRYYHPALARFLNRDSISEAGGLNLYAFVNNNPVNRWDLLGMVTQDQMIGVAGDDDAVVIRGTRFDPVAMLEGLNSLQSFGGPILTALQQQQLQQQQKQFFLNAMVAAIPGQIAAAANGVTAKNLGWADTVVAGQNPASVLPAPIGSQRLGCYDAASNLWVNPDGSRSSFSTKAGPLSLVEYDAVDTIDWGSAFDPASAPGRATAPPDSWRTSAPQNPFAALVEGFEQQGGLLNRGAEWITDATAVGVAAPVVTLAALPSIVAAGEAVVSTATYAAQSITLRIAATLLPNAAKYSVRTVNAFRLSGSEWVKTEQRVAYSRITQNVLNRAAQRTAGASPPRP